MKELAEILKEKKQVVLLTGAGMSTECGIPDFRSTGGYWDGKKYEEILQAQHTGTMKFREWVLRLLADIEQATPHVGYAILKRWQEQRVLHHVITQNVDGFHHEPIEYHGGLSSYYCEECDTPATKEDFIVNKVCPVCKLDLMIRPEMVLYGEKVHPEIEKRAENLVKSADLLIVMGTSLQVKPFAGLVELYLRENHYKHPLWIINQTDTSYTRFAHYKSKDNITDWLQKMDAYM